MKSHLFWGFFVWLKSCAEDGNSIYAASIMFAAAWMITLLIRGDLFWPSLTSGVLMALLSILVYRLIFISAPDLVNAWWELKNISGVMITGIPIEEVIWFFIMGLFGGPIYELWKGIGFTKK